MSGKRDILGLFAALAIAVCAGAPQAIAQSGFQTITTINASPAPRAEPRRTRGSPAPPPDTAAEARYSGRAQASPLGNFSTQVSHAGRAGEGPAATTAGSRSTFASSIFLRPSRQPREDDGIGDADRSQVSQDIVAAETVTDQRSAADRDLFVQPPAGYDPTIFGSELSPILDRRPRQLARFEPYSPVGIRMHSFIVLPEIEFGGAWYSNVFSAPNGQSDTALELRPSIRIVSNWRRHATEFSASAGLSYFGEFDSEDERSYRLQSRSRIDVTRRTNIESLFSYDVAQESRGTADSTVGAADRADVTTTVSALTLNHRFNRLSVQMRGMVEDQDYGNASAVGGGTISNDDQDVREISGATRLTWEFKPTLYVFGELALQRRSFDQAAASDGILRDADGQRYRLGLSFGNTSEILRGDISIGYGHEDLDDARIRDVDGILVDANLAWRPTRLTSVLLTAQSDIASTRVAGSGGARDQSLGLELRHAARRNFIISAGIGYNHRDYDSVSLLEKTWTTATGAEYFANRNVTLFARYQHTWFDSSAPGSDYQADELRFGMRLRR